MASLRSRYEPLVIAAAERYGVPADVYARMIAQESDNYSDDVIYGQRDSSAGAKGIAQFMPQTAAGLGVDPLNPEQAIDGGARYFKQMIDYFGGDIAKGAAAYNAGPVGVQRAIARGGDNWFDYLPQETQAYLGPGGRTYRKDAQSARGTALPVEGQVTQGFGPTSEKLDSGYAGYANFNKGYDFGVPVGTPVKSVTDGTVIDVGDKGDGWGTRVWVRDTEGNIHNYGHLSGYGVEPGQRVRAGQVIASSGNTGASTGPHLSWDVWRETEQGPQYFDYLRERGGDMVMGNGQVGGTTRARQTAAGGTDPVQTQINALTEALKDPSLDPVDRAAIARELREWIALQGTSPTPMTAYQAAQLTQTAQGQADARFNANVQNMRNYALDQHAKGNLTLQQAVAMINRYVAGYNQANEEANQDIANRIKLANEAAYPGQQFYAGFEPGGLASTLSQNAPVAGGAGVGGMRLATRSIEDPAVLRQQALDRLGIEGGLPKIPDVMSGMPVFDPSTVQRETVTPIAPPAPTPPPTAPPPPAGDGTDGAQQQWVQNPQDLPQVPPSVEQEQQKRNFLEWVAAAGIAGVLAIGGLGVLRRRMQSMGFPEEEIEGVARALSEGSPIPQPGRSAPPPLELNAPRMPSGQTATPQYGTIPIEPIPPAALNRPAGDFLALPPTGGTTGATSSFPNYTAPIELPSLGQIAPPPPVAPLALPPGTPDLPPVQRGPGGILSVVGDALGQIPWWRLR